MNKIDKLKLLKQISDSVDCKEWKIVKIEVNKFIKKEIKKLTT